MQLRTSLVSALAALILVIVSSNALAERYLSRDHDRHGGFGRYEHSWFKKHGPHRKAHKVERENMLLLLGGIRRSYECEVPATDRGTTKASCHDHEVIDMKTNKIIGHAVDATTDMETVDGGLVGTGTTFFYLKDGSFVVRGRGTIQPVLHGDPIHSGSQVTHIAGIFPDNGEDNIMTSEGTGKYEDATGTFSLLGALDLSNAGEGIASYYCVYVIDMEYDH